MSSLQDIAKWNSQRNPLEHVKGKNAISPSIIAKPQDVDNAMMVLISEDFDDEERNLRGFYQEDEDVIKRAGKIENMGLLASFHGSGNTGTFYVQPAYRIRKLTEKECFRLMGVKDEDSERVHQNQSKSSMYHLAGDSIVTACLMGLFGEMFGMDWQSKVRELQDDLTHETRAGTESRNDH